jgi:hypothetical protein
VRYIPGDAVSFKSRGRIGGKRRNVWPGEKCLYNVILRLNKLGSLQQHVEEWSLQQVKNPSI